MHGPLTAATLCRLAELRLGEPPRRFSFRAAAPLFFGQPIHLALQSKEGGATLTATRCDGVLAMSADYETGLAG